MSLTVVGYGAWHAAPTPTPGDVPPPHPGAHPGALPGLAGRAEVPRHPLRRAGVRDAPAGLGRQHPRVPLLQRDLLVSNLVLCMVDET